MNHKARQRFARFRSDRRGESDNTNSGKVSGKIVAEDKRANRKFTLNFPHFIEMLPTAVDAGESQTGRFFIGKLSVDACQIMDKALHF